MNTISNPRVTIIMPAYNAAETIDDSIESVLQQTYRNWELIVIDDCSTDKTFEIVQSYSNTQIKLLRLEENKGISAARNAGVREASGEYIAEYFRIIKLVKLLSSPNVHFVPQKY